MNTEPNHHNKIVLSTTEGYYPVRFEDIIYCRADDSYTHVYLHDAKRHTVSRLLKEFEQLLAGHNFFRIHKSYLINTEHIEKVIKADGVIVIMTNGDELPVSFRKKDEFIHFIKSL